MADKNFDDDNLKKLGKGKGAPQNPEDMATGAAKGAAEKVGGKAAGDAVQAGVAVGAALAGKWDTAIKNGIEVLRKRWMEFVLISCAVATITVLQWIVLFVVFIAPIAATIEAPGAFVGWLNDNTVGQITGEEQGGRGGESLCPVVTTPSWSVEALKTSGIYRAGGPDEKNLDNIDEKGCYGKLLAREAQKTGVPLEFIAAIDFRNIENAGLQDCYDCFTAGKTGKLEQADKRLETIGKNLQIANAWRNKDGTLVSDSDGNIRHTIDPNEKYLVGEVQTFMQNYHCLSVKNAGETWCFTDKHKGERYDFYTKDHWMWDGFDADGYKDRLGVLGWYKNKTDANKGCSFDELFRDPDAQPAPGTRLSKVPVFKQADPQWAGLPYDTGTVASHGCGPSALAMVLTYYGHTTNPGEVATRAMGIPGTLCGGCGSQWAMFGLVAPTFGMGSSQIGIDEALQRLEKGEPIIAATNLYGGHFIVLGDKKGDTITVSGSAQADPSAITVDELRRITSSGAFFYVHP